MISEIVFSKVSATKCVSHAIFVAKINELIRAHNAVELAITDIQKLKVEIDAYVDSLESYYQRSDGEISVASVLKKLRQFQRLLKAICNIDNN